MQALKPGQIRVHLQGGDSYVCPEANKHNVTKSLGERLKRIEHYKAPTFVAHKVTNTNSTPPTPTGKSKESLLGNLLDDNKITAPEFITWIEECKSIEDLAIVMKGETRKTVKTAYKKRVNELL